jgi:4-hydroxybenzoate polyprenyltransferase
VSVISAAAERVAVPGLRQVMGSSRPISWVNTAYPFAAAYVLAGGGITVALVVGTLYFLVPYNLLMYGINDVFDYESDIRNARKGGVEGVVLDTRWHRATVWSAVLSNVPFLAVLLLLGSGASALVLGVAVFAVVAYSAPGLRLKERPVLDSITSSTHFVGPAVFGLLLAGAPLTAAAIAALSAFFAWGMASHAFGSVQDINADRGAGLASVATRFGAARTVRLALGLYVIAALLTLLLGWPGALAGLLTLPYIANILPFRSISDQDCERSHSGWRRFLALNYVSGALLTQLFIWATWTGS